MAWSRWCHCQLEGQRFGSWKLVTFLGALIPYQGMMLGLSWTGLVGITPVFKPSHKTGFWKGFWSWLTLFSHLVFFSLMFWFHSGLEIRLVRKAMRALWHTRKRRSLPVEIFVWWDFVKKACPCKFKQWAGQVKFLIHFVAHRWSFTWQDNLGMTQGEIAIKLPCHTSNICIPGLTTNCEAFSWQGRSKHGRSYF